MPQSLLKQNGPGAPLPFPVTISHTVTVQSKDEQWRNTRAKTAAQHVTP